MHDAVAEHMYIIYTYIYIAKNTYNICSNGEMELIQTNLAINSLAHMLSQMSSSLAQLLSHYSQHIRPLYYFWETHARWRSTVCMYTQSQLQGEATISYFIADSLWFTRYFTVNLSPGVYVIFSCSAIWILENITTLAMDTNIIGKPNIITKPRIEHRNEIFW